MEGWILHPCSWIEELSQEDELSLEKYTYLVYYLSMRTKDIFGVKLTRDALKDLKKVPLYIAIKLQTWIDDVGCHGLTEVRKVSGYHDEPLKGKRVGQRSIRLSRAYRAIYTIEKNGVIKFIEIQEVTKHEY